MHEDRTYVCIENYLDLSWTEEFMEL